jgi:NAD(P)H-dependent FMN reductase
MDKRASSGQLRQRRIVGIVGSYRKGRIIDSAVSAALEGAQRKGAVTSKIYLVDKHIEFCANCRKCTQEKDPARRGTCVHNDDMDGILQEIDNADGVVFAAPVNFYNVTAIMRRFIERLLPYAYWPWGGNAIPRYRISKPDKKAVVITSSASPVFIGRIFMPGALRALKVAARTVGAKVVKSLFFGQTSSEENSMLSQRQLTKARRAGEKLSRPALGGIDI